MKSNVTIAAHLTFNVGHKSSTRAGAIALAAALVAGCASTSPELSWAPGAAAPTASTPPGALTAEEMALDCRAITGRMQVRILQIRDFATREQSTALSRTMQETSAMVFGGTTAATDLQSRYAAERNKLEAFNSLLKQKNCPAFDLEAELQPKPVTATPLPVRTTAPANN